MDQQQQIHAAFETLFFIPRDLWVDIYFDNLQNPWYDLSEAIMFVIDMTAEEDQQLKESINETLLGVYRNNRNTHIA